MSFKHQWAFLKPQNQCSYFYIFWKFFWTCRLTLFIKNYLKNCLGVNFVKWLWILFMDHLGWILLVITSRLLIRSWHVSDGVVFGSGSFLGTRFNISKSIALPVGNGKSTFKFTSFPFKCIDLAFIYFGTNMTPTFNQMYKATSAWKSLCWFE